MKYVSFPCPSLEAALSILTLGILLRMFFLEGISENKGDAISAKSYAF
jgi:hypothetical protein